MKTLPLLMLYWFLIGTLPCALAAPDSSAAVAHDSGGALVDNQQMAALKKTRSREPWEYVVSGPFWIATAPITGTLYGISELSGYLNRTGLGLRIYDFMISPDGTRLLIPYASTLTGAGVEYQKKGLLFPGSKLSLIGSGWTLGRGNAVLSFDHVAPWGKLLYLGASTQYLFLPDQEFCGIGNRSRLSDSAWYSFRETDMSVTLGKEIAPGFSMYCTPGISGYQLSDGRGNLEPKIAEVFSRNDAPGSRQAVTTGGVSTGVDYARYDSTARPSRGIFASATAGLAGQIGDGSGADSHRTGYWYYETGAGAIVPLPWGPHRMLTLRGDLRQERNFHGDQIPFYLLSEVGSDTTVRGFTERRFIGNDRAVLSAEYAYPVWTTEKIIIDALLFADAGQVAERMFSDFTYGGFHGSGGFGLRMYAEKSVIGQLIIGFTREGFRLYLNKGI